jgi:N-hydroxyarylamine O-acetyltransferase
VLFRARLFQKIVEHGRGGFCYELNGLFSELLLHLGFDVTLLSARVTNDPARPGSEFDHLTLMVTFPGGGGERWLADVGFGDSFTEPLRLEDGSEDTQGGYIYRLEQAAIGEWHARRRKVDQSAWDGMYDFTLIPREFSEFAPACHHMQKSPKSIFTNWQVCSMATPDGRKTLSDSKFIVTCKGERTQREVPDMECAALMRHEFGIVLG